MTHKSLAAKAMPDQTPDDLDDPEELDDEADDEADDDDFDPDEDMAPSEVDPIAFRLSP